MIGQPGYCFYSKKYVSTDLVSKIPGVHHYSITGVAAGDPGYAQVLFINPGKIF